MDLTVEYQRMAANTVLALIAITIRISLPSNPGVKDLFGSLPAEDTSRPAKLAVVITPLHATLMFSGARPRLRLRRWATCYSTPRQGAIIVSRLDPLLFGTDLDPIPCADLQWSGFRRVLLLGNLQAREGTSPVSLRFARVKRGHSKESYSFGSRLELLRLSLFIVPATRLRKCSQPFSLRDRAGSFTFDASLNAAAESWQ